MLRSFSQLALLTRAINKDHTVWLNEARPPLKYTFKNNNVIMLSMFSDIMLSVILLNVTMLSVIMLIVVVRVMLWEHTPWANF
jgi:hypothetical protein